ncbi:MAG: hypothetical protein HETSPECPRED_007794 [Heterodermia speciosa]|uniref:protein-ribulosamine 3-kinase n=1 Tax=Heterodermia speciosa TaxID=116794 RepID=A0A8H3FY06_9LECA|nr:MAG: hypothetical protein HETSPECPRED_007794 [Heterodermia speciosa]
MSNTITADEFTSITTRQKQLNFENAKHVEVDQQVLDAMPKGTKILSVTPSGASAWVHSVCIEACLPDGAKKLYFLKYQTGQLGRRIFEGTFESEKIFHEYLPEHVPKPHAWGEYQSEPDNWFYLCDFHDMVDEVPAVDRFVSIVARVHQNSMGKKDRYGFHVPTHLANIPNDNSWQSSWETFFAQLMIRMFEIEGEAHDQDEKLEELKEGMLGKVIPRLLRPLETGGRSIRPCLVHSDLWPGNCMPDADTDEIMLFDSCAYWGHNESDLGSWRAPRYRMGKPYLREYQRVMGISEPRRDWDDRNALYAVRYDLLISALYPRSAHGLRFRDLAKQEMNRLIDKHPLGFEGFKDD